MIANNQEWMLAAGLKLIKTSKIAGYKPSRLAEARGSRTHLGPQGSPTWFCRPDAPPGVDPPPWLDCGRHGAAGVVRLAQAAVLGMEHARLRKSLEASSSDFCVEVETTPARLHPQSQVLCQPHPAICSRAEAASTRSHNTVVSVWLVSSR